MESEVYLLNNDDVLSTGASLLMFQCTFKVSEYITMILTRLESENLFEEGLECQLLKPGSYWKKGKIKLRLEFLTGTSDTVSKKGLSKTIVSPIPDSEEILEEVGMWS
ncbi:MAG: KGK domain-containing protein [Cyanobacteria bacterium P01_H01_bin.35]